jgi:hypothetical protein
VEYLVRAYLRRWAVEDATRVIKQEFSLEAIRVENWQRIRRLVMLAGIAYGFICCLKELPREMVRQLIVLAKRLRLPRKVIAYALRKGVAALWSGGMAQRPSFGFG